MPEYRILEVGEVLRQGDEFEGVDPGDWFQTGQQGEVLDHKNFTYRRKITADAPGFDGGSPNEQGDVEAQLAKAFPHGHPEFVPTLIEKMRLHSDKNHDYAKGGNPLGNFERVASILSQYPGLSLSEPVVVMLIYALKQVDATLWGLAQGIDQKVEGPIDRLSDVLVYAGIAICALKDRKAANEKA